MTAGPGTPRLLRPFRRGPLALPNRIVMAPRTRNRAEEGGVPDELAVEDSAPRASASRIVSEASQIAEHTAGEPGTPGIHSEARVAGRRRVADAVRRRGGSPGNRARRLGEVAEAAIGEWNVERVGVRLSPPGLRRGRPAHGKPFRLFGRIARELDRLGAAYVHVVEPHPDRRPLPRLGARSFRRRFRGAVVACGGDDRERAERVLRRGDADLVAFGRPFVPNPDLPRRLETGAPLAGWDDATFHRGGAAGDVDYPALEGSGS